MDDFEKELDKGTEHELEHKELISKMLKALLMGLKKKKKYKLNRFSQVQRYNMKGIHPLVKQINNASENPKIYYGLHFSEGVAEYALDNKVEKLYINNETAKQMNPSFAGRPLYVNHQTVDLTKIESEAAGYVVESFFNTLDGKHWTKFVVVSDEGHAALKKGWRLSNSYIVKRVGPEGKWHGMDYQAEVIEGEYNHLAIVEKPRYDESMVLTPEEFKEYNNKLEIELKKLTNSLEDKTNNKEKKMFKFFKKTKVENSEDLASTEVTIKSGRCLSISQLINEVETKEEEAKEKKDGEIINDDSEIEVGEKKEKVKLGDLKNCWVSSMKKNEEDKAAKEKADKEAEEKAKAEKEEADKKLNSIKNAMNVATAQDEIVMTSQNKIQRGSQLYGSKN